MKQNSKYKILDLFCGVGGLSYGFDSLGFNIAHALDNWKPAIETFAANHPQSKVHNVDITKLSYSSLKKVLPDVDIVIGGPPCQGFSTSGKRALDDPRNSLVKEFLRVVQYISPIAFVMENVGGFVNFHKGRLLLELLEEVEKMGYLTDCGILEAVNYGLPQRRKRFFLIAMSGTKPNLPVPTHRSNEKNGSLLWSHLKPTLSFWEGVSDLPLIRAGEESYDYASSPKNDYQKLLRGNCDKLTLHKAPKHYPHMVELMKLIPQGKSAFDILNQIPEHLRPTSGYPNSYKRIKADEPAPTITRNFTTPSSANCIHPFVDRALTLREGARIQSFPDYFRFLGNFTDLRLLIGNAVPPFLSLAVAKAVAQSLQAGDYKKELQGIVV